MNPLNLDRGRILLLDDEPMVTQSLEALFVQAIHGLDSIQEGREPFLIVH